MHVVRLMKPSQVLDHWRFLESGLAFLQANARETFDPVQAQKHFCALAAANDRAWIGLVVDNNAEPICFGVAEDASIPFSSTRTFETRTVYHRPGQQEATVFLLQVFKQWCRDNNVKHLKVTTKRNTGAVIRCFRHERYGFNRPYLVFELEIK